MFNNANYDATEELADRIERIISRPLFILCFTINPEMLKVYLSEYMDLHFYISREYGDEYKEKIGVAVETIIRRTHLNKTEAKVLALEIQAKMINQMEQFAAEKEVEKMQW